MVAKLRSRTTNRTVYVAAGVLAALTLITYGYALDGSSLKEAVGRTLQAVPIIAAAAATVAYTMMTYRLWQDNLRSQVVADVETEGIGPEGPLLWYSIRNVGRAPAQHISVDLSAPLRPLSPPKGARENLAHLTLPSLPPGARRRYLLGTANQYFDRHEVTAYQATVQWTDSRAGHLDDTYNLDVRSLIGTAEIEKL